MDMIAFLDFPPVSHHGLVVWWHAECIIRPRVGKYLRHSIKILLLYLICNEDTFSANFVKVSVSELSKHTEDTAFHGCVSS